jgi:O-antigen/teichoic acid export membrane protein
MINKTVKFIEELKPHTPNIFWSNLNQVVITASALALSIIFTRLGNKELYGQYLFILAMFGLFSIVSVPGVKAVVVRTTAQGHEGVYRKATKFSFLLSLIGIPLLMAAGVVFYLYKTKILGTTLIVFALFFPFVTSLQNWISYLKGRSEFRRLAFYNSILLLINLVAVTLSIIYTKNIIVILAAYFVVNSGFNILYHFQAIRLLRNDKLDHGWREQSYALTLLELSSLIFGRVDVVLIGSLLTFEQVAIYGLVMKFADVFFSVIKSTMEAIVPNLYQSKKITMRYFYKFFILSFLVPVILYPVIKYPVLFLYGQEYSEVILYSKVYLAIIPVYFLNLVATYFLVKYKLNKEINIGRVISMIAVVVFYATLIPLFGIWGGVIASMLYFITQLIVSMFLLKFRETEYEILKKD